MHTLKNASEIDSIFKEGMRATGGIVTLIARRTPEARAHEGRVLFVAGKRLGGAVVRNRSKRVLRDATRRSGGPWAGWDVVLMARPATSTASPSELDRALRSGLVRVGVFRA